MSVESGLELGGHGGVPRAYVLGTNGNGRAIVSFGDPGTANNTHVRGEVTGPPLRGAAHDRRATRQPLRGNAVSPYQRVAPAQGGARSLCGMSQAAAAAAVTAAVIHARSSLLVMYGGIV